MPSADNHQTKTAAEVLGGLFKDFGKTMSEILEDPQLSEKAKEFAKAVTEATVKVAESKVKGEELRSRIRNVGKAARVLGENLEKHFKD